MLRQLRRMSRCLQYDNFLIDCDGVLWKQDNPIQGAGDTIKALVEMGKTVYLVSNNTNKHLSTYQQNLKSRIGVESFPASNIISSAISTAMYIQQKIKPGEKVYLAARSDFGRTLSDYGIPYVGVGPVENRAQYDWAFFELDPTIKFVVVSFDPFFTHTKLTEAYLYIIENGAEFIASDVDTHFSVENNRQIPGTQAMLAGLIESSGVQPTITGKPNRLLFDIITERHGPLDPEKTIMIGDTLSTDILFGKNCGIKTGLVFTGNYKPDDDIPCHLKPDVILPSVTSILSS